MSKRMKAAELHAAPLELLQKLQHEKNHLGNASAAAMQAQKEICRRAGGGFGAAVNGGVYHHKKHYDLDHYDGVTGFNR